MFLQVSVVFLTLLLYVNTTTHVSILLLINIWAISRFGLLLVLLQWTFCTLLLVHICMHFCMACMQELALWGHGVSMLISCRFCPSLRLIVPIFTTTSNAYLSPVLHILDNWNIIRIFTRDILVHVRRYLMVEFYFSWWLMRLSPFSRDYLPFGHSLLLSTNSPAHFMMSCLSFFLFVLYSSYQLFFSYVL